ncbi:MAG: hypothetical protein QXS24_03800 [Desulfurococcaceae archaeon]
MASAVSSSFVDYVQQFRNFIENFRSKEGVLKYYDRVWQLIKMGQRSLILDFDDLILFDQELANKLVDNPSEVLEAFNQALYELIERENPEYARLVKRFYVRIRNPPKIMKIRELNSDYIGKLVAIEGIVTRVTRVDAKLVKAVYKHVTELEEHEFEYPPEGVIMDKVEKPAYCPVCRKPGKFELIVEKSEFIDWQKIVIQEKPEEVPGGQIPRSIESILTGDIVDSARPGDRVVVTGILRVQPLFSSLDRKGPRSIYAFYIDVNHIDIQEKVLEEIVITREDEEKIWELARDPWIREKIIASIAPGIYGYWDIKEAIALLLFGGSPKVLRDGTRIRGDIHVLITGDPGTAKSQLLQFTSRIAPRGLYTSGKGSTAAGLTATVLRDKLTGEYYLEAGALVLADGGVACLHPDTRVLVNNEYLKISELFKENNTVPALSNNELVELNYIDHEVVGLNIGKLSSEKAKATVLRRKYWKGKLVKITLESGHEIILTPDHLLLDGDTLEWKPAGDFKPGDLILSLLRVPGHNRDVYVLDIVPDDWIVVLENENRREFVKIIRDLYDDVDKLREIFENDVQIENDKLHVRAGVLKHILKHSGRYEDWRNRHLSYKFDQEEEFSQLTKITPEFSYLMGFVFGRSKIKYSSGEKSFVIKLRSNERAYLDKIISIFREYSSREPVIKELATKCNREESAECSVVIIESNSHVLLHAIDYFTSQGLRNILKLPDDVLKSFIAGLFDSNGLILVKRSSKGFYDVNAQIAVRGVDEARALTLALRRFDIYSKVKIVGNKIVVSISGRYNISKFLELIEPYSMKRKNVSIPPMKKITVGKELVPRKLFIELVNELKEHGINEIYFKSETTMSTHSALSSGGDLSRELLVSIYNEENIGKLPSKARKLIELAINRDYYLDKVVKVEDVDYEGYVYDLYVPGLHNFLAEGIIVHNCIDEIDKMREEDRSAIHEALEQQTVSIAKAGIVARLNARASVLAAGNPKYGRYDPTQPVSKNIDLPPTILSRFDLIFIVQDIPQSEQDRRLARHILGIHTDEEKARGFIDPQLLKKYVSYARRYIRPQLTPEASKLIEEFYVSLRQASLTTGEGSSVSAIAITPRQLEALIRLTEAHAKMSLKQKASIEDAEEAIRLMMVTLSKVGFDVESGRIDIDILESGVSASRREKRKRFIEFLFKLLDDVGGEIELNELFKKSMEQGFEKEFVKEVISELKKNGEIYEPRVGKIAKIK